MGADSNRFDYGVDSGDFIVSLGDAWLDFARENGAPELSREALLGRSLWQYVAGESTRQLYELLFGQVREQGKTLVLPFRCDSPDRFRFMQLAVAPGARRGLQLSGRLVREQPRPYLKLLDRLVTRSSEPLPICSVCLRVEILGTRWVEAEAAVERLDLFSAPALPPLDYRVCADCVQTARGLSAEARSANG